MLSSFTSVTAAPAPNAAGMPRGDVRHRQGASLVPLSHVPVAPLSARELGAGPAPSPSTTIHEIAHCHALAFATLIPDLSAAPTAPNTYARKPVALGAYTACAPCVRQWDRRPTSAAKYSRFEVGDDDVPKVFTSVVSARAPMPSSARRHLVPPADVCPPARPVCPIHDTPQPSRRSTERQCANELLGYQSMTRKPRDVEATTLDVPPMSPNHVYWASPRTEKAYCGNVLRPNPHVRVSMSR